MESNIATAFPKYDLEDLIEQYGTIDGAPITKSFKDEVKNIIDKINIILEFQLPNGPDISRVKEYYNKYRETFDALQDIPQQRQFIHLWKTTRQWFITNLVYNTSWIDDLNLKLYDTLSAKVREVMASRPNGKKDIEEKRMSRIVFPSIYRNACQVRDKAYQINSGKKENGDVNEETLLPRQLEISLLRIFYLSEIEFARSNIVKLGDIPHLVRNLNSVEELEKVRNTEAQLRYDIDQTPILMKRLHTYLSECMNNMEADIRRIRATNIKTDSIYEFMGKQMSSIPGFSSISKDGTVAIMNEVKKVPLFEPVITTFESVTEKISTGGSFDVASLTTAFKSFRGMMDDVETLAKNKEKEAQANKDIAGAVAELEKQNNAASTNNNNTGAQPNPLDMFRQTLDSLQSKANAMDNQEKKENNNNQ